MNPKLDHLFARRSVRRYQDRPVAEELLTDLLQAAMAAPSAVGKDPWHFIVVRDREVLEAIPRASPYASMTRHADVAVVVCGILALEKHPGFWVQDCSNAAMNILNAAHALGLGAVWTAAWPMEDRATALSALLGIPEGVVPLCVIPIGHPKKPLDPGQRFEADRIHRDRW